jgi:hypothetical protein
VVPRTRPHQRAVDQHCLAAGSTARWCGSHERDRSHGLASPRNTWRNFASELSSALGMQRESTDSHPSQALGLCCLAQCTNENIYFSSDKFSFACFNRSIVVSKVVVACWCICKQQRQECHFPPMLCASQIVATVRQRNLGMIQWRSCCNIDPVDSNAAV